MDWEGLFAPQILDRGLDYYQRGLVTNFVTTNGQIQANVLGTERYRVTLTVQDDQLVDADCDCPYAAEGEYCKHMAAVLFMLDETPTTPAVAAADINDLVAQADDQQVRTFLTTLLQADNRLVLRFKATLGQKMTTDLGDYRQQIDDIFNAYMDRYGFIDYESASDFEVDLTDFMTTDIADLISPEQVDLPSTLLEEIMIKLAQLEIDDSDGELMMLMDNCSDVWQQILEQANLPAKRQLFDWLRSQLTEKMALLEEVIEDLLFDNFKESEFMATKLTWTAEKLKQAKKIDDDWVSSLTAEKWALYHVQTLVALKRPNAEIDQFFQENSQYSRVRQYIIDRCIQQYDFDRAIQLLKAGKQQANGIIRRQFSVQLKDLFHQLKRPADYQQALWSLLTTDTSVDMGLYHDYKRLFSDNQWPVEREKLLSAIKEYVDIKPILADERLLQPLLTAVLADDGLESVQTYEKLLKPKFAKALLTKYVVTLQAMAEKTGGRKYYQQLVAILRRMLRYPQGKSVVVQVIADWRERYGRRRAMMDELDRLDI